MKKVFYHNKYFNINKLCVLWGKLKKSFIPLQLIGFYIIILKMYKRSYLLDPE